MDLAGAVPGRAGNKEAARRSGRLVEWTAAVSIAAVSVLMLSQDLMLTHLGQVAWGADFTIVRDAAARWLDTGVFYLPEQLAGPYYWPGPWVLYPPPMLILFVPFVVLPGVLWWAIPLGVIAWAVWKHRPRPIAWAVILFCVANPTTVSMTIWGNPGIWFVACVALATHYPRFAPLVLLKPTLLPFALVGIWKREWWAGALALGLVSLPFLPMLPDYTQALSNAMGGWGNRWMYSLSQVPAMLLPLVAYIGRTDAYTPAPARLAGRPHLALARHPVVSWRSWWGRCTGSQGPLRRSTSAGSCSGVLRTHDGKREVGHAGDRPRDPHEPAFRRGVPDRDGVELVDARR